MTVPVSCAVGLRCIDCGAEHPLEYLLQCRRCRGLLEPVYDLEPLRRLGPARAFDRPGLWRYHPVLPIRDPADFVTLGEGQTPLLDAPVLARTLGVRRLLLKFEGTNPTGTIKDRSSATAVAAARQFGYRAISVVSTGNAGSSIGAYATRAGLRAFVFCYEQASAPKMHHMGAVASDLVLYQGYYDDLIRLWDRMVDELPVFDGGASRNADLMQFQADILDRPVVRSDAAELSARGAAWLAGLAAGTWPSLDALAQLPRAVTRFEPRMPAGERDRRYAGWQDAIARSRSRHQG